MIKFSIYYHEEGDTESTIKQLIDYARKNRLYIWQLQLQNDAAYYVGGEPDNFVVDAWMVTGHELQALLIEEQAKLDDIPF